MSENNSRGKSESKARKKQSQGKREREVASIYLSERGQIGQWNTLRYILYLEEKEDKKKEKRMVGWLFWKPRKKAIIFCPA
jgi:hypothetical protein